MNEQEKKWPCPQCTYDNYLASVKCALCLHPRDSALIHLPPATASENGVLTHKNPQINNNESALIICPPAASSKVNSSKTNSFEVECASVKCEDKPQTSLAADNKDTEKVQRWFCSVCTHENLHAATQCFQCHSIKPELVDANLGKPRITNEQPQKWACPICTYENWNASKYCTVCRTDRCNAIDRQSNAALENIALIDARHSTNDEFREQEAYLHKSKEVGVSSVLNTCAQRESAEIAQLDNFLTAEVHHPKNISRSSSSSSSRSHSPRDDVDASGAHQTRSSRRRRQVIDNQVYSILRFGLNLFLMWIRVWSATQNLEKTRKLDLNLLLFCRGGTGSGVQELTPARFCIFLSDPDPESLFNFVPVARVCMVNS